MRRVSKLPSFDTLHFAGCGRCSDVVLPLMGCLRTRGIEVRCNVSIGGMVVRAINSGGVTGRVICIGSNGRRAVSLIRSSLIFVAGKYYASASYCNSRARTPSLSNIGGNTNRS